MFLLFKVNRSVLLAVFGCLLLTGLVQVSQACPFCSAPSLTLSEQLADAELAALGQWTSGTKPTETQKATTTFTVLNVAKNANDKLQKKQVVTLEQYLPGKPGDLYLLTANTSPAKDGLEWSVPLEVTETSYDYIVKAPNPEVATGKRLAYFIKYLEYPDQVIANDAYAEFANAPYEDIATLAEKMPREQISKWVTSDETSPTRLGLYGLMLGLCGNDSDARKMQEMIAKESDDFRLGIQGVMAGYLVIKGKEGLTWLEAQKLKPAIDPTRKDKIPFSETYASMQALRFMWTYGKGKITNERLQQSMRILLDQPDLCDLVIPDLARWKDWSVQDRLMKMYNQEEFSTPPIKRSIVQYLLACSQDVPAGVEEVPAHAAKAKILLDELRETDPKTVRNAERFFLLN